MSAVKKRGHIAKACCSWWEGKKDKQTKWTKHLDAAVQPDECYRSNAREPMVAEDSGLGGLTEDIPSVQTEPVLETPKTVSLSRQETRTSETQQAPALVTEYQRGNVKGLELFAVQTQGDKSDDTCTISDADIEKPYHVYVRVNKKHIKMEIDTGAALSVISEKLYNRRF